MLSMTKEPKHATTWRSGRFLASALAVYAAIGLLGLITQMVPSLERQVTEQNLADFLLPPLSDGYLFGTDELGRDFMWRLIGGLAVSMSVGFVAAALSIILGLVLGIIGGFFRRTAGASVAVLVDVTWAFPEILLAIMLVGWLGSGSSLGGLGPRSHRVGELCEDRSRGGALAARARFCGGVQGSRDVEATYQPLAPRPKPSAGHDGHDRVLYGGGYHRRGWVVVPWSWGAATDAEPRSHPGAGTRFTSRRRGGSWSSPVFCLAGWSCCLTRQVTISVIG